MARIIIIFLYPWRMSRRAIGLRCRKPSFATIARELESLLRLIRTLFFWLRLVSSLWTPIEPITHNRTQTLEVVEPSTSGCGAHRRSANVDKKFGRLKKHPTFRYAKINPY